MFSYGGENFYNLFPLLVSRSALGTESAVVDMFEESTRRMVIPGKRTSYALKPQLEQPNSNEDSTASYQQIGVLKNTAKSLHLYTFSFTHLFGKTVHLSIARVILERTIARAVMRVLRYL